MMTVRKKMTALGVIIGVVVVLSVLASPRGSSAKTTITHLTVEYGKNPMGMDVEQPRFSWQMSSDRRGEHQSAYRIVLAADRKDLSTGHYVYDTGKVDLDESVGIPYNGPALRPSTRYYWKVTVWDSEGNEVQSTENTWFETGLLGSGWDDAKWIGSSEIQLAAKYRTHYVIDFDVRIAPGSRKADFVFGARDENNYVKFEIDLNGSGPVLMKIYHMTDGRLTNDVEEDISDVISNANMHEKHRVKLDITTALYALSYWIDVSINGTRIKSSKASPQAEVPWMEPKQGFRITPYPEGERVYECRLHSIGFLQEKRQKVIFTNLTISEKAWAKTLYRAPQEYILEGEGKLDIWDPSSATSAPMLRKSIHISKDINRARLYATARGIYEFYINGRKVGRDYFNPGWTDYRFRFMYNTFDITNMLRKGDNAIGAMLGTGWWSEHNSWDTRWQDQYGIQQSLMGKLLIEYSDGSSEVIITDESWKLYDYGPITYNGFQNGEDYDATKEVKGWDMPGFDDSFWKDVVIFEPMPVNVIIHAYVGETIQKRRELTSLSVNEPVPGVFVYDMGVNMVGVPRITLKGKAGQRITLRFGEMIYPETVPTDPIAPYTVEMYKEKKGQIYTENYRGAKSIDHYIMKGDSGGEVYEPRFTFHGFRYIEITGIDSALPLEDVKGIVLDSIGEQTSHFETSNRYINQLYSNILWGQRGNFLSVPTDCPQRDERQGYLGDAQLFTRSATYNMNVDQFLKRWLYSVRDNQGEDGNYATASPDLGDPPRGAEGGSGSIGWSDAGIIVPWQMYQQYGDKRIIEQSWDSMIEYMNSMERQATDYIQPPKGIGDHLAIDSTNPMITNTAYFAYDAKMMAEMAKAIGKDVEAARYERLFKNIKDAFNKKLVDREGYTWAPKSEGSYGQRFSEGRVDTQTSYALPLYVGLFSDKNQRLAARHLVDNIRKNDNKLTTGFIGTPYLNPSLSENGYDDVAYALFEQTEYPSWLYPVLQGATTMWERWNSYTLVNGFGPVDMNSFNHYAYGAIGEWMFAYCLGIQRDENEPGYKHIILQPRPGGALTYAKGYYDSMYGRIESSWEIENDTLTYSAVVPPNTWATLYLPADESAMILIDDEPFKDSEDINHKGFHNGKAVFELVSGRYEFSVKKK